MKGLTFIIIAVVGIGIYYLVKYIQVNGMLGLIVGGFVVISVMSLFALINYAKKYKIVG